MAIRVGNGGCGQIVGTWQRWQAFDSLPERIKQIVRDAGVDISPVQVADRVADLRHKGLGDEAIALWMEQALKALTHQRYREAGHPQFEELHAG